MARNGSPNGSMQGRFDDSMLSPVANGAPQSKRDKRRLALKERLNDMMNNFSRDQHEHYYAQLVGLQCDMNLIMRADSYRDGPLDDDPEHINGLLSGLRAEATRFRPISADAEHSFNSFAGKYYTRLVTNVNSALERRDVDLTNTHTHYHDALDEIRRTHQYKTQLAHEEHRILVQTIRERLIQQTVRKKERLIREKEQLDIGESSALLLNPAQYTVGHPASPGGPQNPRKTRHTRLRPDEDGYGGDSLKRKRKAPADELEHDSPTPNGRSNENKTSNPYKDAKAKAFYAQQEAPLFSVSNLFTEKELALNLAQAHVEANNFFARAKAQANGASAPTIINSSANGMIVDATSVMTMGDADGGDNETASLANGSPSLAPAVPVHATRSSHRTNPVSDLATAALTTAPFFAVVPSIPLTTAKGNPPHAPTLPGINDTELANDLAIMRQDISDPIIARLAERCIEKAAPFTASEFEVRGRSGLPPTVLNGLNGHVANAAAIAMQRQESGPGLGLGIGLEMGGSPMLRERSLGGNSEIGDGVSAADFGSARKK